MKRIYLTISLVALLATTAFMSANAQQTASGSDSEYIAQPKYKDFRVAIGGGYARRLGALEKTGDVGLDAINKKLMNGFNIDADAQYFFKQTWGLGLNANMCVTNGSGSGITINDVGSNLSLKVTQRFTYMGPSFVTRTETNKFLLTGNVGFGPLFFNEDSSINGVNVVSKKTTVGTNLGLAGEYKVNQKTGVGLKLSYVMGTIDSVNIEGQKVKYDNDAGYSVSNLMATLFVSFRSW